MKKTLMIAAMILCLITICCGCSKGTSNQEETTKISTPYADLCIPKTFEGNVTHEVTSENPYTLVFKAQSDGTELFSIVFNGTGEVLMGTLVKDDANTVIYMNLPALDSSNANYETYCGYQEGVNTIMNHLAEDYDFRINELVEKEDNTTYDIATPIVTMKYPAKWKDKVQVEVSANGAKFSNNGTPLFDLVFGDSEGYLLGTYNGTPIHIIDYPVNNDEQAAMQEDVNVILQNLMEDKKFVINQ